MIARFSETTSMNPINIYLFVASCLERYNTKGREHESTLGCTFFSGRPDTMKRLSFGQEPEVDSANIAQEVMLLLARSGVVVGAGVPARPQASFECRTCKRRFPSFQALGGHRTSHKRPRGGGGAAAGEANALAPAPAPARRHGCTVCGVEFALGQALGGHMRRHRSAGAEADEEEIARGAPIERKPEEAGRLLGLDLNATPSEDSTGLGPLVLNNGPVDCLQ